MRIDIISIFPDYLAPLCLSIVGRAQAHGVVDIGVHDLRSWATDRHRTVDDTPYGGGPGMVMRADIWGHAIDDVSVLSQQASGAESPPQLVIPTPSGRVFDQSVAADMATVSANLIIACGRYEGIDARVAQFYAHTRVVHELSIGDVVLAGGEPAALVMVEAITRLLPGALGNRESAADDSFAPGRSGGALEGEVYTRPLTWRGLEVPEVLLSGHHQRIADWRSERSGKRTQLMRPDLCE